VWLGGSEEVALRTLPISARSLDERSQGIEIVVPTRITEDCTEPLPEKAEAWWRRFSLLTVVFAASCSILIGTLTFWSYRATAQRAANAVAWADVVEAARALQGMSEQSSFQLMIRGPAFLPDARGTRVSEGTTLFLERRGGETYVRGTHTGGTTTYYAYNGDLYMAPGVD
jgi:hypothetical protein